MELEGTNVYLSGPMSGYPHNNVEGFARAHAIVRGLGAACVYDPAQAWLSQRLADDEAMTHEDYMLRCLGELTRKRYMGEAGPFYDVLVSLPGWYESEGATTERDVAEACGIECVDLYELEWHGAGVTA